MYQTVQLGLLCSFFNWLFSQKKRQGRKKKALGKTQEFFRHILETLSPCVQQSYNPQDERQNEQLLYFGRKYKCVEGAKWVAGWIVDSLCDLGPSLSKHLRTFKEQRGLNVRDAILGLQQLRS